MHARQVVAKAAVWCGMGGSDIFCGCAIPGTWHEQSNTTRCRGNISHHHTTRTLTARRARCSRISSAGWVELGEGFKSKMPRCHLDRRRMSHPTDTPPHLPWLCCGAGRVGKRSRRHVGGGWGVMDKVSLVLGMGRLHVIRGRSNAISCTFDNPIAHRPPFGHRHDRRAKVTPPAGKARQRFLGRFRRNLRGRRRL